MPLLQPVVVNFLLHRETVEIFVSYGSDFFPSHENYYAQVTLASGMNTYEQLIQQYQQSQSQSQFQLQQISVVSQSYEGQNVKSTQGSQVPPDPFCMLGLLNVVSMHDPDLTSLALGIDLTMVGLSLNSTDSLYRTLVRLGLLNLPKGSLNIAFQHVIMPKHRCLYINYISQNFSYQPCFTFSIVCRRMKLNFMRLLNCNLSLNLIFMY